MNPTLGAGKTFWSWTRLTSRAFGPGLPEDCDPGGATSPIEGSQRPHDSCFRAPGPSEAGQLGAGRFRPPTRLPAQPGPPRTAGSYPPPPPTPPFTRLNWKRAPPIHSLGDQFTVWVPGPEAGSWGAIPSLAHRCAPGVTAAGPRIYTPICSLIQSRNTGSLVYTPGLFLCAQPSPQLTTPAWNIRPSASGLDRGPPESPCGESRSWKGVPPPWSPPPTPLPPCQLCPHPTSPRVPAPRPPGRRPRHRWGSPRKSCVGWSAAAAGAHRWSGWWPGSRPSAGS